MTQNSSKSSNNFYCCFCDYSTCRKSHYERHLTTRKHKMITNDDQNDDTNRAKLYMCICGKKYKDYLDHGII